MIAELKKSGCNINLGGITHIKTINLYNSLVTNKMMYRFDNNEKVVRFVLHKMSEQENIIKVMKEINLNHEEFFISPNTIDMDTVTKRIALLSTYVYFDRHKHVYYGDDVFIVVISKHIEFVSNSKMYHGFCLLKCCLRHSFDSKTENLQKARKNI